MAITLHIEKTAMLPQEIEVWYVLPALRCELAKALAAKGITQKKVASLLGVTGAAVSHYVNSKRAQKVSFSAKFREKIAEAAGEIENGRSAYEELQRLVREFRGARQLCEVHRSLEKVPRECKACLEG